LPISYADTPQAAYAGGAPGAAASPYVVAMTRLQIPILPHITNAVLLLSAFSAGNSYVYCASRSLYGLALEHKAPRFLTKCAPNGVPVYCVLAVLVFALLSFLQVSNSAAVVLGWFINLVTASQLINFTVIAVSFIAWKRACDAQGLDRKTLPYMSKYQPYQAYVVLFTTGVMTFIGGYEVFLPGNWNVPTFLFSYCSVFAFPVVYLGWKFWHKTKILKPTEVILRTFEVEEIEKYTEEFVEPPPRKNLRGFWGKIIE
jgi:amino acid transporter